MPASPRRDLLISILCGLIFLADAIILAVRLAGNYQTYVPQAFAMQIFGIGIFCIFLGFMFGFGITRGLRW